MFVLAAVEGRPTGRGSVPVGAAVAHACGACGTELETVPPSAAPAVQPRSRQALRVISCLFAVFGCHRSTRTTPSARPGCAETPAVRGRAQRDVSRPRSRRPDRHHDRRGDRLLDAGSDSERIIGDVVNTASRLEGIAEPGGIVIDERTYLAIRNVVDCDPLEPVTVKGKVDVAPVDMVGREGELSLLSDALDLAITRRSPKLVTIPGEPGVGKSRLVSEFWSSVDERADVVVRWRQGRPLPGEGVTLWALSEIVKAEAGILESESPAEARTIAA